MSTEEDTATEDSEITPDEPLMGDDVIDESVDAADASLEEGPDALPLDVVVVDVPTSEISIPDAMDAGPEVVITDVVIVRDAPVEAAVMDACPRPLQTFYEDSDRDGYGNPGRAMEACTMPMGWVLDRTDCNDTDPMVNPRGMDVCDGRDRSCDNVWRVSIPAVCTTIQGAIDTWVTAGRVSRVELTVAPGTYRETINTRGLLGTLRSMSGSSMTTLAAPPSGSTLSVESGERDLTISGFTIEPSSGRTLDRGVRGGAILVNNASVTFSDIVLRNARITSDSAYGAAMAVMNRSNVTARKMVFEGNEAGYYGGALSIDSSQMTIRNAIFRTNRASYGGAIASYYSSLDLANAIFVNNLARAEGGGLFVQGGSASVTNCVFHGNTSSFEGGAMSWSSAGDMAPGQPLRVLNTSMTANTAMRGGAAIFVNGMAPSVRYSNAIDNGSTAFSGLPLPSAAEGNISIAPSFMNTMGAISSWNFRLTATSPLINAGDPSVMDPDTSRSDIGAYGGPGANDW